MTEFDRLEAAVSSLAEAHLDLQADNAMLRSQLDAANQRVRTLDTELLVANQRRQDTAKRIDELIAHLDQLDSQLDAELESAGDASPAQSNEAE